MAERTSRRLGRTRGPLLGSLLLNVTVLGFEQNLEFGLLGCAERCPISRKLRDYLVEEASTLIESVASKPEVGIREYAWATMGDHADVAQLVERDLAKVEVAGSSPVVRSSEFTRPGP